MSAKEKKPQAPAAAPATTTVVQPAPTPVDDPNVMITPEGVRISLLPPEVDRDTRALEAKAEGFRKAMEATDSMLRRTMLKGSAIKAIREGITQGMGDIIMSLMNNPLGFMTDRNPKARRRDPNKTVTPYDRETVLDAVAHGLLSGVFPFNNELNIISGGMMIVLNGWRRLVSEIPNLDYPAIDFGDPVATPMHFLVPCTATWVHKSKLSTLKRNVFVKRDPYTTTDQVMGKAERKMLKAVYMMVVGPTFAEVDDDDATDVVSDEEMENLKARNRVKAAREGLVEAKLWTDDLNKSLQIESKCESWTKMTTAALIEAAAKMEKLLADSKPKQTEIPPAAEVPAEDEVPADAASALATLKAVANGYTDVGLQDCLAKLKVADPTSWAMDKLDALAAAIGVEMVVKLTDMMRQDG